MSRRDDRAKVLASAGALMLLAPVVVLLTALFVGIAYAAWGWIGAAIVAAVVLWLVYMLLRR